MAEQKSKFRRIWLALAVLVLLGAGLFGYWYLFVRGTVSSDDARLDANLVNLAPDLPGRLERLLVAEGDKVRKDQPVFVLDQSLFKVALDRAQAQVDSAQASLAVARAKLSKLLHGTRVEEIQLAMDAEKQAKARAELSKTEYERTKGLHGQHAIAGERLDQARTAWIVAENAHDKASHNLALLRHGARQEDVEAARAGVEAASARLRAAQVAVDKAKTDIEHSVVRAPFSGPVVGVWRRPGAILAPGTPVVTLIDPASLHVAANIDEKDLSEISVGDPVDISIDAFPDRPLKGKVSRIMQVTNSTFSLIPAEGVSGTFIKVTQRVPIRIALDSLPDLPLGPGLSVEVHIHTGERSGPDGGRAGSAAESEAGKTTPVEPAEHPTEPANLSAVNDAN